MKSSTTSKVLAKIQLFLAASMLLLAGSCQRKPLFLPLNNVIIRVAVYDVRLDLLWGVSWQTEWQYEWDETLADYGVLGYTQPDLVKGTVYNVNQDTRKRMSSFFKIFDAEGGRVNLEAGHWYDMLFYNFGTEWTSFYQDANYEYYDATTRTSSQASWTRTEGENEFSEMPDTTKTYIDYNQPDELFGTLVTGLEVSKDPTIYEKEYEEDGTITYIYKIDAELRPYSFIYLLQVMVINNYDNEGQIVTGARGMTVTGLSQGVELYSRKTFNNTISITTEDVKEMQHKDELLLPNGSVVEGDVMAARMLTWGLPGIDPLAEATRADMTEVLDGNYLGIGVTLRNGYTYTVTRDITEQMHNHPAGGVITVVIDANGIPSEYKEKKNDTTGGGFNASVENWNNEVNADVTI